MKGKAGSKNNIANRGAVIKKTYNGEIILPVKLMSGKKVVIAAKFEKTGKLVTGPDGAFVEYGKVQSS